MEVNEDLECALNEFARNPQTKLPPLLDEFLSQVAATGQCVYSWPLIRPLILCRLESCLADLGAADLPPPSVVLVEGSTSVQQQKLCDMRDRIVAQVSNFVAAPFTIQRLCELVVSPRDHYKRADKFLRGMERTIMVVSSVDPFGSRISDEVAYLAELNAAATGASPASSTCSGRSSVLGSTIGSVGTNGSGLTPRSRRSSALTPNGGIMCSPGGREMPPPTLGGQSPGPPGSQSPGAPGGQSPGPIGAMSPGGLGGLSPCGLGGQSPGGMGGQSPGAPGCLSPNRPSQALSPSWRQSGGDSPSYDAAEFKTPGGRCSTPPALPSPPAVPVSNGVGAPVENAAEPMQAQVEVDNETGEQL